MRLISASGMCREIYISLLSNGRSSNSLRGTSRGRSGRTVKKNQRQKTSLLMLEMQVDFLVIFHSPIS